MFCFQGIVWPDYTPSFYVEMCSAIGDRSLLLPLSMPERFAWPPRILPLLLRDGFDNRLDLYIIESADSKADTSF